MPTPIFLRESYGLRHSALSTEGKPEIYISGLMSKTCPNSFSTQMVEVLAELDKLLAESGSAKTHILFLNIRLSSQIAQPGGRGTRVSDGAGAFTSLYDAWKPNPAPPYSIQWVPFTDDPYDGMDAQYVGLPHHYGGYVGFDKVGALIEITAIATRKNN